MQGRHRGDIAQPAHREQQLARVEARADVVRVGPQRAPVRVRVRVRVRARARVRVRVRARARARVRARVRVRFSRHPTRHACER